MCVQPVIIIKCSNKSNKNNFEMYLYCVGRGSGYFLQQRDWGEIPTSPFKIGFAIVCTIPMKNSAQGTLMESNHHTLLRVTIRYCLMPTTWGRETPNLRKKVRRMTNYWKITHSISIENNLHYLEMLYNYKNAK